MVLIIEYWNAEGSLSGSIGQAGFVWPVIQTCTGRI